MDDTVQLWTRDQVLAADFRNAAESLIEPLESAISSPLDLTAQILLAGTKMSFAPVAFLYRHAIELNLKQALRLLEQLGEAQPTKDELKGRSSPHDLVWLTDRVLALAPNQFDEQQMEELNPLSERLRDIRTYIEYIDDLDPRGDGFRYSDPKSLPTDFSAFEFIEHARAVWNLTALLVDGLNLFVDAMNGDG